MPPQQSTWDAAVARVEGQASEAEQPRSFGQAISDFGVPETLGGIGGGLMGGIPGAVGGAALMRYLKGRMRGNESVGEAATGAMGQGLLEALPAGLGRALKTGGTAVVRSTLPKATGIFADVGRGNPFVGRQQMAERLTAAPGLTPHGAFGRAQTAIQGAEQQITRGLRTAQRRGVTMDVQRMTRPARQEVSKRVAANVAQPGGTRTGYRMIEALEQQPSQMVLGRQVMDPTQVRRVQRATKYSPFEPSVTRPQVAGALRQGMSAEMKRNIPELAGPLGVEAQNIPIRNLLAEMVPGSDVPGVRMGLRGVGAGVPAGVARGGVFAGGKLLHRTGQAAAASQAITPGLLRLLLAQQSQQP